MDEIALPLRSLREPLFVGRFSSDEHLARMASRGDTRAFAVLYERHHQPLFRYCQSIVRQPEDAREALQNTMMRALAALRSGERDLKVRPWLFRIAHNESISILRRRRPVESIAPEEQPSGFDVERTVDQRERMALLLSDLQMLVERQRAALVMRELSGLSIEEIASALSCSPGAAKQALFEARTALHEMSEGRAMGCEAIRRAISECDGRVLRGRKLRAHLRTCAGCREFEAAIGTRSADLRALTAPLPPAAGIALLKGLLAGGGHAGGGTGVLALGNTAGGATVASGNGAGAVGITATGATGAGVAGTSAGGTVLGGHLMGSLVVKMVVGAVIVAAAATGATHLALGPAHSRGQASSQPVTNNPGGGRIVVGTQRVPPAAPKPKLSAKPHARTHVPGVTGGLGMAGSRHSTLGVGRERSIGAHGEARHASPAYGDTLGKTRSVERRSGGASPRGSGHANTHRSPNTGKAGGHMGNRSHARSGESPGVGKAGAKAPNHHQPTSTSSAPASSPRSNPAGGSGSVSPEARAHSQSARSTSS